MRSDQGLSMVVRRSTLCHTDQYKRIERLVSPLAQRQSSLRSSKSQKLKDNVLELY